ncbi:MAG: hypothetical protein Q4G40_01070, partial [Brachybacterium sp.]|nr:hypothetical protein [Brachybacterium sp.]
ATGTRVRATGTLRRGTLLWAGARMRFRAAGVPSTSGGIARRVHAGVPGALLARTVAVLIASLALGRLVGVCHRGPLSCADPASTG